MEMRVRSTNSFIAGKLAVWNAGDTPSIRVSLHISISLLNGDLTIISKDLFKPLSARFNLSRTNGYVKNKRIGESGRLISDVTKIDKVKKLEGFLVVRDIQKAFDSLDHNFLISILEKYGFCKDFIWRV